MVAEDMMKLAAGGGGVILFLTVIFIVIINVIRLALQRTQQEQTRRRGQGEATRKKPSSGTPAEEIQKFLAELSGSRPVTPQRPSPPAPRPRPQPEPAAQAVAARAARLLAADRARRGRGTSPPVRPPVREVRTRRAAKARLEVKPPPTRVRPKPKAAAPARPVTPVASPVAATYLDAVLPSDPFKRAVILREILGPCRTARSYRPGAW